jgi:hypothetical protein
MWLSVNITRSRPWRRHRAAYAGMHGRATVEPAASRLALVVGDGTFPMHDETTEAGRPRTDRRSRPTSPWDALRPGGRRRRPRRRDERQGAHFVDRFHPGTLALVVALLVLTIADGVLTLELIHLNSEEANPVMAHLLRHGELAFLMGKYIMTAAGLPFLVVYQHYPLCGGRFRVGWLLPVFIALYVVLLFHQCSLLQIGRPGGMRPVPAAMAGGRIWTVSARGTTVRP